MAMQKEWIRLKHEFCFTRLVIILVLLEHQRMPGNEIVALKVHRLCLHWYQFQNDNAKKMNTLKTWILFHPFCYYPCSFRASECSEMESIVLKVHRYHHFIHLQWYQIQNDNLKTMNRLKTWILFHPSCCYPCSFRAKRMNILKTWFFTCLVIILALLEHKNPGKWKV